MEGLHDDPVVVDSHPEVPLVMRYLLRLDDDTYRPARSDRGWAVFAVADGPPRFVALAESPAAAVEYARRLNAGDGARGAAHPG
jgi:hypothetical protein